MNQPAGRDSAPEFGLDGAVGALADDALEAFEAQRVIDALVNSPALRATWDELHWVGDCLRSEETGAMRASADFMARFSERLAAEATVLAPRGDRQVQRRWLRYGVPGAAVAAAVSMVVWIAGPIGSGNLVAGADSSAPLKNVAAAVPQAPATVAVRVPASSVMDAAQLREYVMAHQEFGATGLHGPGSIQAASFDIPAEGSNHP